jgi:hypothetical protein
MKTTKKLRKQAPSKGKRLNWTPVEKAEKLSLKKMNVTGKRVSSEAILKSKKFVGSNKRLLIP